MDPECFYQLSERLVKGDTPAEIRSAISRAYYAAFHVAAGLLQGMGFRIRKTAAGHVDVTDRLLNSGHDEMTRIARNISDLRGWRNAADYDLDDRSQEKKSRARLIVKQVRGIIGELKCYCNGPEKAAIKQNIHRWEINSGNVSRSRQT